MIKTNFLFVFVFAILEFLSIDLCAQSEITIQDSLSASVVGASARTNSYRSNVPVATIDEHVISHLSTSNISDVVRLFAGVSVKDYGGIGGIKTVSVRGLGTQHTAVSYDGIPISNSQNGQIDLSRFLTDNIASLSMSIGQSDDIHQPAKNLNSAGLLSISSQKPDFSNLQKPYQLKAKMSYGSFSTYNPSLNFSSKLGNKWALRLAGDWISSRGDYPFILQNGLQSSKEIRRNSDVDAYKIETDLYGDFGEKGGSLTAKAYYYNSERGLPGSVVLYNNHGSERLWDRITTTQVNYSSSFSNSLQIKAIASYNNSWNRYLDMNYRYSSGSQEDKYDQNDFYGSLSILYKPSYHWSFSMAHDENYATLFSTIPECLYPRRFSTYSSLSGKYFSDNLSIIASVLALTTSESVSQGKAAPDRHRFTPSLSVGYKPFSTLPLRIRASWRNGYRIPTFNDLYYSRVGNRDLRPEIANQYNIGLSWALSFGYNSSFMFTVDGYYNDMKDKIVAMPTMFIWSMRNLGKVQMKGLDLSASSQIYLSIRQSLQISANYSFQKALDLSDAESRNYGHQIPYTPLHSASAFLSWRNPWANASLTASAASQRWVMGENIPQNSIAPYCDLSLCLDKTIVFNNGSWTLKAEMLNLLNTNYEIIKYYPMMGRSFRLSLIFSI